MLDSLSGSPGISSWARKSATRMVVLEPDKEALDPLQLPSWSKQIVRKISVDGL